MISSCISQLSENADNQMKVALHMDSDDKRAKVLFADTITLLFESIARVVEIHQPLVETYYGRYDTHTGLLKETDVWYFRDLLHSVI